MPPIPPQPPSALAASVGRRIADIRGFQIPRLRSCQGPLTLHQQYSTEIREDIEAVQRSLKELEVAGEDEESESDREKVRRTCKELDRDLNQLKKECRAAVLSSKRAIDGRNQRSELLADAAPDPTLEKSDDALMNTSNEVTLALRRTMQLMQQEVERSVLSTQLLDESSRTLHSTSNTYASLSSLLDTSKALITALEKADWMDRLLILGALTFFLLVVAYILKQRIFDRGVRLAFWWVKYLPTFVGDDDFGLEVMEKGAASVLTTVVTAAASAAVSRTDTPGKPTGSHSAPESLASSATLPRLSDSVPDQSVAPLASLIGAWDDDEGSIDSMQTENGSIDETLVPDPTTGDTTFFGSTSVPADNDIMTHAPSERKDLAPDPEPEQAPFTGQTDLPLEKDEPLFSRNQGSKGDPLVADPEPEHLPCVVSSLTSLLHEPSQGTSQLIMDPTRPVIPQGVLRHFHIA